MSGIDLAVGLQVTEGIGIPSESKSMSPIRDYGRLVQSQFCMLLLNDPCGREVYFESPSPSSFPWSSDCRFRHYFVCLSAQSLRLHACAACLGWPSQAFPLFRRDFSTPSLSSVLSSHQESRHVAQSPRCRAPDHLARKINGIFYASEA